MRWTGALLAVALVGAACGDDGTSAPPETTTTILTVVTGASSVDEVPAVEVFVPWHQRGTFDPLDQDPGDCFVERDVETGPDDLFDRPDVGFFEPFEPEDGEDVATLDDLADSWLVADTVPALDPGSGSEQLIVEPGTLVLHPAADFAPTRLAIEDDNIVRTVEWLQDRDDVSLVAISLAARESLRADFGDERTGVAHSGWAVIGGDLISFSACDTVERLAVVLDDLLTEILGDESDEPPREADLVRALETFAGSRDLILASMGIGSDGFRFADCAAPDPGIIPRLGFGGSDIAIAWGSIAGHEFGPLDIGEWTTLVGGHDPATQVRAGLPTDWPSEDWFVTFDATDPDPSAILVAGIDPVLGLYLGTSFSSPWETLCDFARDVLAFAEFLDGVEPDRERWDLPDGEDGDEQIIIDTLLEIRDDPAVQEKFLAWTPCTYKLCVLNGDVPPRIS